MGNFLKRLSYLIFIFSALYIFLPKQVLAVALTSVTNVPWSSDVSVSGKHTINFTTGTTVPADGKIIITYPAGFNVTSAVFDSWSGFDGGRSVAVVGQIITITRDNTGTGSTAGAKYIVLNNITNNSAVASNYTVSVETQTSASANLDGPTSSANFSVTATGDELDTTSPWPMRGHDNRNSFSATATAPDYPTLAWKFTYTDNDNHNGAVEDSNGVIYIVGTTNIYALNSDGTTKWSVAQSNSNPAGTVLTTNSRLVIWYRNSIIESRNINDGSLEWSYTPAVGGTDAGSLSVGPDGTIFISNRFTGIEGINSDGTRKFYNSATNNRDSTPAVDNATGQIYTFSEDTTKAYNPDGTIKWSVNAGGGASFVGNPAQLNSNGSVVCAIARSTVTPDVCQNTSDGSTLWSVANAGSGYGQGAFSPDNSIYYTPFNAISISARNATTGVANWTQTYTGGFGYAGGGNLMVDANNRIYAGRQAFNSDGTSRWTLSSTGSPIPIIGISNTMVYYDRGGNLYNYKPWTLSGSVNNGNRTQQGQVVTVTVTSSMLKRDPAASDDNLVQAIMSNGDKVILYYDSASGGNTTWKSSYTIPPDTANGSYTATVQAASFNVVTDVATTLTSLPTGFNNTGVASSLTYNVAAAAVVFLHPAYSPLPSPTPTPTSTPPSTSTTAIALLRFSNTPQVYAVIGNQIKWIPTAEIFNKLGYNWSAIKVIDSKNSSNYKIARLWRANGDSKVYYITETGLKRWVPTADIFLSYGNAWSSIVTVIPDELQAVPDNTLVRPINDSKVYKLENGQKRWISSADTFQRQGFDWLKVAPVNQQEADFYPNGGEIH